MPDLSAFGLTDDELREEVATYRLTAAPPTTPACEPHEPQPAGYIARLNWAEVMGWTHKQRRCRGCGLWLIWEPKPGTPATTTTGD